MRRLRMAICAATIGGLGLAPVAQASPIFASGLNKIAVTNYENQYRKSTECGPGECFEYDSTQDPTGWRRVIPASTGDETIREGDVFLGIIQVQEIRSGGSVVWQSDDIGPSLDQFTGYFAQEVKAFYADKAGGGPGDPYDSAQTTLDHIALTAPSTDPFGILGPNEMFRLYVDNTTAFNYFADVPTGIALATDGSLWASLGTGTVEDVAPDYDGYAYSHGDTPQTLDNFEVKSFLALNYVQNLLGPKVLQINDTSESELGDVGGFPVVFSDFVGNTKIIANPDGYLTAQIGGGFGSSPWAFQSDDPLYAQVVPEPGTMILLGSGLLGLAGTARRNRKKKRGKDA